MGKNSADEQDRVRLEKPARWALSRRKALRAFFIDGLTHAQVAERFGYTRWAMVNLGRSAHRHAGTIGTHAETRPGVTPAKDRARKRVIELRREGLSTYEISAWLAAESTPLKLDHERITTFGESIDGGSCQLQPRPRSSWTPATDPGAARRRSAYGGFCRDDAVCR